MKTAERIRSLRARAEKSTQEVATAIGLNEAEYRDLESYDDELSSTLTLFQASLLASQLGVRLQDLVEENASYSEKVDLKDLPGVIERYLADQGLDSGDLETLISWEIQGFLHSPIESAAERPIAFLRDLSNHLGISLWSLLPNARTN